MCDYIYSVDCVPFYKVTNKIYFNVKRKVPHKTLLLTNLGHTKRGASIDSPSNQDWKMLVLVHDKNHVPWRGIQYK